MMKYQRFFCLLCALLLTLALCACNSDPAQPSESSAPPVTEVPTQRMTDAVPPSTQAEEIEVQRGLEEIRVYPFTEEELADAQTAAQKALVDLFADGIELDILKFAFDPALTDANIRQKLKDTGSSETEEQDYARQTTFIAECFVMCYKEVKGRPEIPNRMPVQITVSRADKDGAWQYLEDSYAPEGGKFSDRVIRTSDLQRLDVDVSGRVIAGYWRSDDALDLYCVGEDGKVSYCGGVLPNVQKYGTEVDADTLASLQKVFDTQNMILTEEDWYAQCLTSEFASPADVDLRMLFYNGIIDKKNEMNQLSEEERAHLASIWGEDALAHDVDRMPVKEMNRVLQKYFGITLDETEKIGLEHMLYWDKTDCYYCWHGDSNFFRPQVYKAFVQEDGTIAMYYVCNLQLGDPNALAMLKPVGDGYQILSNEYFD